MSEETKKVVEPVAPVVAEPVVAEHIAPAVIEPVVEKNLAAEIAKGLDIAENELKIEEALVSETLPPEVKPVEPTKAPEPLLKVVPDPVAEKESIEAPVVDDAKAVITDALLERAAIAGMSLADAKSFQNAEALDRTISLLEKSKTEAVPPVVIEPVVEKNPFDDIPDLDPEVYDEKLVEAFSGIKALVKTQADEIKELRGSTVARKSVDATKAFDDSISALGADYHDTLGTGDIEAVKSNKVAFDNRVALAKKVEMIQAGYDHIGETVSREKVFAEAVGVLFPTVAEKVVENPAVKREAQIIAPPGKGTSKVVLSVENEIAGKLDAEFGQPD